MITLRLGPVATAYLAATGLRRSPSREGGHRSSLRRDRRPDSRPRSVETTEVALHWLAAVYPFSAPAISTLGLLQGAVFAKWYKQTNGFVRLVSEQSPEGSSL